MSDSKDLEGTEENPFSTSSFLKDVFMCSLVAFGGPEAHLGVFLDRLVVKKNYLTEKALMEWMALCSFLPGPTSTQVITGIGLTGKGRAFPCFINLGGLGTTHESAYGMLILYSSGIWFFEFLSGLA